MSVIYIIIELYKNIFYLYPTLPYPGFCSTIKVLLAYLYYCLISIFIENYLYRFIFL